jgi:DNA polymerase elongation subunit (family B)
VTNSEIKVLSLDLETSPYKGYFWGVWQQNIASNQIEKDRSILCASYSWLFPKTGNYSKPKTIGVADYDTFSKDPYDDKKLMKDLREIVEEADVLVGHNVDGFDYKLYNTRAFINGLEPTSPKITIDTLKILRRHMAMPHNRLDSVGKKLGIGGKLETRGMDLWIDVVNGSKKAMKEMEEYCERDVEILNQLYFLLRSWDTRHPSFNMVSGEEDACPTCGNHSLKGNPSWVHRAQTRLYPRYKCKECGSWCRGVKTLGRVNARDI